MAKDKSSFSANKQWINSESFWNLFCFFERLNTKTDIANLYLDLEVDESMIHQILYFYQNLGVHFQFEYEKDHRGNILKRFILPPKERPKNEMKIGLSEWKALQAHFPFLAGLSLPAFQQTLSKKMAEVDHNNPRFDLVKTDSNHKENNGKKNGERKVLEKMSLSLEKLALEDDLKQAEDKNIIARIEKCLAEKMVIELDTAILGSKKVYPLRMVYLGEQLYLIAEDLKNLSFINIPVSEIYFLKENWEHFHESQLSLVEMNQFINGIRMLQDQQMRLIVKFKGQQRIDPPDQYHFFTNPYIVTNHEGDFIWAATTEISQKIYQWLMSYGDHIEILGPVDFAQNFSEYCQRQKRVLKKTG
jgi:predicted DNA-binding transcriptional regulator YafY